MKTANALMILAALHSPFANAGRVRTLPTSSREMPIIFLMTGRSTVLRLPSAPKKVVLGNQNYFNVEFIDSDITIQPQGTSSSNLFVYGDGYTYGFILKVNSGGEYDDLVFVRGKLAPSLQPKQEQTQLKPLVKTDLKYEIISPKKVSVELQGSVFKWNENVNSYFTDIFIVSKIQNSVPSKSLELRFSNLSGDISSVPPVFADDLLIPNKKLRVRIFSKLNSRENAKIRLKLASQEVEFILKWKK